MITVMVEVHVEENIFDECSICCEQFCIDLITYTCNCRAPNNSMFSILFLKQKPNNVMILVNRSVKKILEIKHN